MRQLFRHSLAVNFSIFCGAIAFACALIVAIFFFIYQQQKQEEQSLLYGETILENLVQAIELAGEDSKWLQAYVVSVGTSPGILQVHLSDAHGKTQAHSDPVRLKNPVGNIPNQNLMPGFAHLQLEDEQTGEKFLRISQPVDFMFGAHNEQGLAMLDVAISDDLFSFILSNDWVWFFLSLFLVTAFGIGFIFLFLNRRVIQVARSLQAGATAIAKGDFDQRIAIRSADELGDVARSFNRMAQLLGENVVSRIFFDNILRSMAESLIILDARQNITMVNQATVDLLGYSQEELLGKQIGDLLGREQASDLTGTGTEMYSGFLDVISRETVCSGKNDLKVPVLFSAAPLKSAEGELEGTVCIVRDIRERKVFEEQITRANTDLMAANAELKKTQAQLIQAAKLASLGEMATGIAHELNQPLHLISMGAELAELFLAKENKDLVKEKLEGILSQVNRATMIINHLRTFGRESHREEYDIHDLNQIVNDSLGFFREQFRLHDIELASHLEADLPHIFCNPIQIEQVISNLLHNARDAMNNTPLKKITLRSFRGQDTVILELSDTGEGIAAKDLQNIFDPFFTTKPVGKGTGLGLSISYGIIKEHGGHIEVKSDGGQGALFTVTLPTYKGK